MLDEIDAAIGCAVLLAMLAAGVGFFAVIWYGIAIAIGA